MNFFSPDGSCQFLQNVMLHDQCENTDRWKKGTIHTNEEVLGSAGTQRNTCGSKTEGCDGWNKGYTVRRHQDIWRNTGEKGEAQKRVVNMLRSWSTSMILKAEESLQSGYYLSMYGNNKYDCILSINMHFFTINHLEYILKCCVKRVRAAVQ